MLVKPVSSKDWGIINPFEVPELKFILNVALSYIKSLDISSAFSNLQQYCFSYSQSQLLQTLDLHILWLSGHLITIYATFLEVYIELSFQNSIWHCLEIAIFSTILTYSIVVYRHLVIILSTSPLEDHLISVIIHSENTCLLMMAILTATTKLKISKLLPFVIYSFINLNDFIFKTFDNKLVNSMAPLLIYLEEPLLKISVYIDIFNILVFIKEAFDDSNFGTLAIYCFLFASRLEFSDSCRSVVHKLVISISIAMQLLLQQVYNFKINWFHKYTNNV